MLAEGQVVDKRPVLTEHALFLLEQRYLRRNEKGEIIETPRQLFERVARCVAYPEKKYGKKNYEYWYNRILNSLLDLDFVPASPYLFNARDPEREKVGGLFSCFVIPLEDSIESIYKCMGEAAKIYQHAGGVGIDLSPLREKGAPVKTAGGVSSGPLSFLEVFNKSSEVVVQGGVRRAASIAFLDVSHPDIIDFISIKSRNLPEINRLMKIILTTQDKVLRNFAKLELKKLQQITSFNLSVKLTDKFMNAVANDEDWHLISPSTKKVVKTIKARKLFRMICEYAWRSGDPGVVFIDTVNKHDKLSQLGRIEASNPCHFGSSKLLTPRGFVKIKDLVCQDGRLVNAQGDIVHGKVWYSGKKKVVKLVFNDGNEIICTPDHKYLTEDGEVVQAADLKGKRIAKYRPLRGHDPLFVKLGYIQGDGILSRLMVGDHLRICFGQKDGDVLSYFGYESNVRYVTTREFDNILGLLGFDFRTLPYRTLPSTIFDWDERRIRSFLCGLYSANGSILNPKKYHRITLKTTCRKLAEQVQELLLRFNIKSYITTNKSQKIKFKNGTYHCRESYDLNIGNMDGIFKFYYLIGFIHEYKNQRLEQLLGIVSDSLVVEVVDYGEEDVYDFTEPLTHWGIVSGLITSNCSEIFMHPYESCNLNAINLTKHIKNGQIDWEKLRQTVQAIVHVADNAIDVSAYPLKEIEKMTKSTRGIGIGVMGFADILVDLGIPYDSVEARNLLSEIYKRINEYAIEESKKLAEQRGVFKLYKGSYWDKKGIKVRNAFFTTAQPTGSVAIIAGVSHSIEPYYNVYYQRRTADGDVLTVLNERFECKLRERGIDVDKVIEELKQKGTIQKIDWLPKDIKELFKCAHDIHYTDHLAMQAAAQKYVDSGISKTINCPADISVKDVEDIYFLAWKWGCKGVTIFREGCKEGVLSLKSSDEKYHDELREFLIQKFCREGLTAKEISELLGVSEQMVFSKLKRYGIKKSEFDTAKNYSKVKLTSILREIIIANLMVGHSKITVINNQGSYRQVIDHLDYATSVRAKFIANGISCTNIMSIATDKVYYYFDTAFLKDICALPVKDNVLQLSRKDLHELLTPHFVRHLFLVGAQRTGHGGIKFITNSRNGKILKSFMWMLANKVGFEVKIKENEVYIPKSAVGDFYAFIESSPFTMSDVEEEAICPECGDRLKTVEGCLRCLNCGWGRCSI
ncbi:MAG: hypothetical protein DRP85_00690 [Candidatus Makaraimicrobium thalassicum]|nr:MAG: hypothetical protein DRP85_00690 [Candidatus Omnitrophota bacterium]